MAKSSKGHSRSTRRAKRPVRQAKKPTGLRAFCKRFFAL